MTGHESRDRIAYSLQRWSPGIRHRAPLQGGREASQAGCILISTPGSARPCHWLSHIPHEALKTSKLGLVRLHRAKKDF